jgi:hypothetical protein
MAESVLEALAAEARRFPCWDREERRLDALVSAWERIRAERRRGGQLARTGVTMAEDTTRLKLEAEGLSIDLSASTCKGRILLDGRQLPVESMTIRIVPGRPLQVEATFLPAQVAASNREGSRWPIG